MRKARNSDHVSIGYLLFVLLVGLALMVVTGCAKQGPQGAEGLEGPKGAIGSQGPTGPQGLPGSAGINGTNGTVITPVEFCPNFIPTYASEFPEYGFCINNTLWGVYSANGGFMTELPPGQYSSDGINASCTFTIGANCEVTND